MSDGWPAEYATPAKFLAHLREECGYSSEEIAAAVEYMIWKAEENCRQAILQKQAIGG